MGSRTAIVRAFAAGVLLAAAVVLAPQSTAHAQQPPSGPGVGVVAVAPGPPPPYIYGFFRDPLWPGPGVRFIAEECPIGVGLTIVHYCPGQPPIVDQPVAPPPVVAPDVRECDPWFQYYPVCRRSMLP
ncbi:MAG TPA: hypothetical protein VKZ60_11430 [Chloroflexota bacterium]|nr:hypothetical protein [Chloroflexota bacterium]